MSILVELPERLFKSDAFAKFEPVSPYSLGAARAMAWMSQLAYETAHRDKIESICRLWDLRLLQIIANDNGGGSGLLKIHTRGVIVEGHGAIMIAFAGTDPLVPANWISDFDVGFNVGFSTAPGLEVTPGPVHRGFDKAFDAVSDQVTQALAECGTEPLLITGHSMGAALAVIAADHCLTEKKLRATAVYAFGMPRIGDEDFAVRYNETLGATTYRLVHGDDIVATVPPSRFGFRHVGRLISCARGSYFAPDQPAAEFSDEPQFGGSLMSGLQQGLCDLFALQLQPTFRDDALGRMSGLLVPPIADHLPDRYLHACEG
jgi:pimeloyl-ACP methyl ester carboxylesterase